MGKLACICGNILSDVCGNDAEAFREDQIEIITRIGFEDDIECYESGDGRGILECEECGSLAIEDPMNSNTVKFYIPENRKFNKLFRQ